MLGFMTALRHLNLSGCGVTDNGIRFLSNLTNLESLHLLECTKLTDASLSGVVPLLPGLTDLDLSECARLTDKVGPILIACTTLKVLNLQGCDRIRGIDVLTSELGKLPNLERLIVAEAEQNRGEEEQDPWAWNGGSSEDDLFEDGLKRKGAPLDESSDSNNSSPLRGSTAKRLRYKGGFCHKFSPSGMPP